MPRVETNYTPSVEPVQVVASPNIKTVMARNDPNSMGSAFQLAKALGEAEPYAHKLMVQEGEKAREAARAEAYNMPVSDLEKAIKDGNMLPVQSPIRAAALRHVYGENLRNADEMDVLTRAQRGEFATWADAQKYLSEKRANTLQNQDEFVQAGYSKNWQHLENKLQTLTLHAMNQKDAEFGMQQSSAAFRNIIEKGGDAAAVADALGAEFERQKKLQILPTPGMRKESINNVLTYLTKDGQTDTLNKFLKQSVGDGITVTDVVGMDNAAAFLVQANKINRARAQQDSDAQIDAEANKLADKLVNEKRGSEMPDVNFPQMDGTSKVSKGYSYTAASVERRIQANPNMPIQEQVREYANNGVDNEAWKKEFTTATYNLGELGVDAYGKPIGNLLPSTKATLDKFSVMNQTNDAYLKSLLGETNYKTLYRVQALREAGVEDITQAADLVNQINRRSLDPKTWGSITTDINKQVDAIKNPSFFSGRFWGDLFRGEFGKGEKNILPIADDLSRLAETYLAARVAPDAKTAVEMASTYMTKSTIQINNTLYRTADLPQVPAGENAPKWFETYMSKSLIPELEKKGIKATLDDLTLVPVKGGQKAYRVQLKGQPIAGDKEGLYIKSADEVQNWIKGQVKDRNTNSANEARKDLEKKQNGNNKPPVTTNDSGAAFVSPKVKGKDTTLTKRNGESMFEAAGRHYFGHGKGNSNVAFEWANPNDKQTPKDLGTKVIEVTGAEKDAVIKELYPSKVEEKSKQRLFIRNTN